MGLSRFSIDASDPLNPKIEIDGQEPVGATRVTVDLHQNQPPRIYLEGVAQGVLEGKGVTHIVRSVDNPMETIISWLSNIDPASLERAVLDREAPGMKTGEIFLAVLTDWANGVDRT